MIYGEHYGLINMISFFPSVYTIVELRAALTTTTVIPFTLTDAQLRQTLFRCVDTLGTINANAYCINGCQSLEAINGVASNDQCTA